MPKRLLFVTGTRADFGKIEPLASAAADAGHDVGFFATGMHVIEKYGMTVNEVERVPNTFCKKYDNVAEGQSYDYILGRTVIGFGDYVCGRNSPDLIVVHGDRVEAFAAAFAGSTSCFLVAHIEGGEVSGTTDEMFRHCITKLSHHHFVSSEKAARRVKALGEPDDSIYVIGSPELDRHARPSGVTLDEVRERYEIAFDDYGICIFHPVTTELIYIEHHLDALFGALEDSGRNFVVIMPNNDPGSRYVFKRIGQLPKERFRCLPSMRFAHFSELMKNAALIVGNSSVGVREAPFLGVPSLDVGTRQHQRASGPSIHACLPLDEEAVAAFLDAQWGNRYERQREFGDGKAAGRFVKALEDPGFWSRSVQKAFIDVD